MIAEQVVVNQGTTYRDLQCYLNAQEDSMSNYDNSQRFIVLARCNENQLLQKSISSKEVIMGKYA